jgi:diacylglycerol kinase family enzyme
MRRSATVRNNAASGQLVGDAIPQQHIAVDGEVITQTPARVSVAREALFLMVPQGFEEAKGRETGQVERCPYLTAS